jgi:hypothetical protein
LIFLSSFQRWFELNCTVQEFGSVPIYEPCNYASNVAYYYTASEICDHDGWTLPLKEGIMYFFDTKKKILSKSINHGAGDHHRSYIFMGVRPKYIFILLLSPPPFPLFSSQPPPCTPG